MKSRQQYLCSFNYISVTMIEIENFLQGKGHLCFFFCELLLISFALFKKKNQTVDIFPLNF